MNIFFITGMSSSLKKEVMQSLNQRLSAQDYKVYDFEEAPHFGRSADRVLLWIKQADENALEEKSTVVCGPLDPAELEIPESRSLSVVVGIIKEGDGSMDRKSKSVKDKKYNFVIDAQALTFHQLMNELEAYITAPGV